MDPRIRKQKRQTQLTKKEHVKTCSFPLCNRKNKLICIKWEFPQRRLLMIGKHLRCRNLKPLREDSARAITRDTYQLYFLLHPWRPESRPSAHVGPDGQHQEQCAKHHAQNVFCGEGPCHVPGPFFVLPEASELHCVRYSLDPVHAHYDHRYQYRRCGLQPLHKRDFFAHLDTAGLLSLGDLAVLLLDVRNIPESKGNGNSYFC